MIIQNILVPYEGSLMSKKALELGKEIALNFNATLNILMVVPLYSPINDSIYVGAMMTNYQKIVKELTTQGEKNLSKVTEKCHEEGAKVSYKIVHDDVSNAILKQAKKNKTDLIIMGSRRMKGLAAIKRIGSTARYISEHAVCPVTIVH